MTAIIIAMCLVAFLFGYGTKDEEDVVISLPFAVVICLAIFFVHALCIIDTHPLLGNDKAKYFKNDNVIKPDGKVGRIDSIYYMVDDSLYLEKTLKPSKR